MSNQSDHGHGHGHGHGHAHGHAHGHGHGHGQALSPNQSALLESGSGRGKVLFLDILSGIAGDMTIAALLDLGVPWELLQDVVGRLGIDGIEIERQQVMRGAVGATHFDVRFPAHQPERSYAEIRVLLERSSLPSEVVGQALGIFERLARAESEVHRIPLDAVQFHEVGAVDAIVDIVGAAACFDYLGARVLCSPVPLGSGSVDCQHGVLPLPAPATVNCLLGVPTYAAGIEGELVTPTGAAIVASVARGFTRWPSFAPERVGWGAGSRELADRPNALRVVLGQPARESLLTHSHVVVEATVDDMTGELAGHALSELLRAGALDAWASPVLMKKGRPGLVISALAESQQASAVADVLFRETSTIGVRFSEVSRRELSRRMIEVTTEYGELPVKLSGDGETLQFKPEFEACVAAARRHHVPVRMVVDAARSAARSLAR